MLEEFHLTEEEFLIINKNEKKANKQIIQNEQIFKSLLNEYLKNQQYEAANVPNDGSCLYHAILHSFAAKYGQPLEINHQKMREKVSAHMLREHDNMEYLRNFAMNENDGNSSSSSSVDISIISSKKAVQERYVKYAKCHMYNTLHWPVELCLHIVAKLYNLHLTVLQEAMDPQEGQSSGYICERLRTVGLLPQQMMATSSSTSAAATTTTSSSSTTSYHPQLLPSPPPPRAIIIGNRWDQHYYSIGSIKFMI